MVDYVMILFAVMMVYFFSKYSLEEWILPYWEKFTKFITDDGKLKRQNAIVEDYEHEKYITYMFYTFIISVLYYFFFINRP